MKFTEAQLEEAIIQLLGEQGHAHVLGETIDRAPEEVLIVDDIQQFLSARYAKDGITPGEIQQVVARLQAYSSASLYESNKAIMKMVSDGFTLKREDPTKKDLFIELIDYAGVAELRTALGSVHPSEVPPCAATNIFKVVSQLTIEGQHPRIPDGILYVNGLPLVVFEFKTAIKENTTIHAAYTQITVRYERDIPELFKYNAFCVISDGVNNKVGSFFAPYEFYYAWRKTHGMETGEQQGINSLYSMIEGLFHPGRLCDVVQNFVYVPDKSNVDAKILCRYPQYYAATKLYQNILVHMRPDGDGKGGTYFGATGSGKSFTMLFLARLLMKSVDFSSPTIVLITDRTDLDEQLAKDFTNAKTYLGDEVVKRVESREDLRTALSGRNSGGVFLTTIQKFTEDTHLLTDRMNVICISDEAHRSQTNLDQKVRVTETGVKRTYGFAKYLHDSLPNATFVGFTGTPTTVPRSLSISIRLNKRCSTGIPLSSLPCTAAVRPNTGPSRWPRATITGTRTGCPRASSTSCTIWRSIDPGGTSRSRPSRRRGREPGIIVLLLLPGRTSRGRR